MAWRASRAERWGVSTTAGSFGAENEAYHAAWRAAAPVPAWWAFLRVNLVQGVCGLDHQGLPVYYSAVGHSDLQGCEREVGLELLQRYCVMQNDSFLDAARAARTGSGACLHGGIVIVDLDGLSWRHAREAQVFNRVVEAMKALHPERQRRCFMVRAPHAFAVVWRLVRPVIDPRTAARITILGSRDSLQPLLDEAGPASVPQFLGGTSTKMPEPCTRLLPVGEFHRQAG